MTEDEKKTLEQMFEAMGNTGGRFVIGQVVGSQTININGKAPAAENKGNGGRPKRKGKAINKAFIYDAGSETNTRLQLFYYGLLSLGWIKPETDLKSFLSVFSGKDTAFRIVWTGEINTLSELFRELVTRKRLVQLPQGESLWLMVNARFWEKEGGKEFGNDRLRTTRTPVEGLDKIETLVKVMNPDSPIEELRKAAQSQR